MLLWVILIGGLHTEDRSAGREGRLDLLRLVRRREDNGLELRMQLLSLPHTLDGVQLVIADAVIGERNQAG